MRKVVYLHGLESSINCKKVKYLRKLGFNVLNPSMDYYDKKCFIDVQYQIQEFQPDLIIGSSMGGWFAYLYGKYFETPVVLLNPALHSRSFEPDVDQWGCELHSKIHLITGRNDDIIDPLKTVKLLNYSDPYDFNPNNHIIGDWGHRTPVKGLEMFFKEYNYYLPKVA